MICGRVTQTEGHHVPPRLRLDDGSAAVWVLTASAAAQHVGDFVQVRLSGPSEADPCTFVGDDLRLLARPVAGEASVAPGSDWYRLQKDQRSRLHSLEQRSVALGCLRRFFAARAFVEIEAPLSVPSPGLELHLSAYRVEPGERFLITSPEYQCKRLLAGGLSRIFSLGKVFRQGETGPHHNPEFTMLEWYRAYADWRTVADDVATLVAALATELLGEPAVTYKGQRIDLRLPWPLLTVSQAMKQHAGVTLRGDETTDELRACLTAAGHRVPAGSDVPWDDLFFGVFLDHVEPKLSLAAAGQPLRPVILHDWPLPLSALARRSPHNPAVVERFEAYVGGLELCNGFGELCDPIEQAQRMVTDQAERARRGLPVYPMDTRFLQALSHGMPPSGGVALGVDRLLMLLFAAEHIQQVLPFSFDEL